jgi:hypothetical protein
VSETMLACRGCGQATTQDPQERAAGVDIQDRPFGLHEVGTCPDCASLGLDEPGAGVRALMRVARLDESAWPQLSGRLLGAGVDASAALYRGVEPQDRPWAHVPREAVKEAKRLYVDALYDRVHASSDAASREVPPAREAPSSSGQPCAFCGVLEAVDFYNFTPSEHALGLNSNPGNEVREVCGRCADDGLSSVGAIGPRAVAAAWLAFRGLDLDIDRYEVGGLEPYLVAARGGVRPGEPWHWVGDDVRLPEPPPTLESLARRVAALEALLPTSQGGGR